jgi:hypothetical protein
MLQKEKEMEVKLFWKNEEIFHFVEPCRHGQILAITGISGSMSSKLL